MKESWRPGNMIYPLPAMLISCGATPEEYNVFTASWVGTICSDPAMCYVSIRPSRHSYDIVRRNMAFTINLTNEDLAQATDWCGVRSGRDINKFSQMGLTPVKGQKVPAPYIDQAPVCIECRVKEIMHLGSHDMFIADVVNVLADSQYLNPQTGELDLKKARLIAYSHGEYFKLGEKIGNFGWTVKKK
ncbi:MAG: flavin reductase family protein [Muribaculaceae bacterium]